MLARYINDSRSVRYNNAYFDKRPEAGFASVVALRDIEAGEEILVSYGKWYWSKEGGNKLQAPDPIPSPWPPQVSTVLLDASHIAVVAGIEQEKSAAK
jgi:hypothetical protein